jgi:hypothetical protein
MADNDRYFLYFYAFLGKYLVMSLLHDPLVVGSIDLSGPVSPKFASRLHVGPLSNTLNTYGYSQLHSQNTYSM